jgi:hypothetical protein
MTKKPPITLEITNKPMRKYQNTPKCIKAILSYLRANKYFTYFKVCAKQKKNPWLAGLHFVDLEGRKIFLLHKII